MLVSSQASFNSPRSYTEGHQITLKWVPGYKGIKRNEEADDLAKEGANTPFPNLEPFCGLSRSHKKDELRLAYHQRKLKSSLIWTKRRFKTDDESTHKTLSTTQLNGQIELRELSLLRKQELKLWNNCFANAELYSARGLSFSKG